MAAPTVFEASDQERTRALKDAVFSDVLKWFSGGAVCVVALLLAQAALGPALSQNLLVACALIALLPGFLLVRRVLGYPRTAVVFLGYLLLLSTYGQCQRGLTPGIALVMVTFLLLSGLFFGARGARWAFAASLSSLVASGLFSTSLWATRWEREFWDPHQPIVWLRYAMVLFFFGGSLLSAFVKLNEGHAQIRAELEATRERERSQREQRERAEQALEQARRLEALAQFAGGLAHDFNNNLMVILAGSALLAEERADDARVRAVAQDIQRNAELGAESVRRLLTLGRKTPVAAERIAADTLVQYYRPILRKLFPAGVEVSFDVDSEVELSVDVAGLQQVLLNLALNARDALGERGAFTLRIRRRTLSELPAGVRTRSKTFVVLSCHDTGAGMDQATRARLFEPFFTTKEAGKGTGLGLAQVQRFMDEASGFITVESELGVGTSFHLHFPMLVDGSERAPEPVTGGELRPIDPP